MDQLKINGNNCQAAGDGVYAPPAAPDVSQSDYILVELAGPPGAAEQDQLAQDNVDILQYMGKKVFLCSFKPKTVEDLQTVINRPFVVRAEVYHPNCVAEPALKEGDDTDDLDVEISLHQDVPEEKLDEVKEKIAQATGVTADDLAFGDDGVTSITIKRSQLSSLAEIDEVYAINRYDQPELFNNVACEILKVRGPTGIKSTEYTGGGQKVCVADTGFDTGTTDPKKHHPAFETRVKELMALGRPTLNLSNDPDGHGTHVCGSVLGKLQHAKPEVGMIEGAAPGASLYVQSLFDGNFNKRENGTYSAGLGGLIDNPAGFRLFRPAFERGVYIHTNSWGGGRGFAAQTTDSIDDFAWRYPAMTILFAAGNDGRGADGKGANLPSTVSKQATSKNCIAVGASESTKNQPSPGKAASPDTLATFSSCGPTRPGRQIKPDIVAPGTAILSAKSSVLDPKYRDKPKVDKDDNRLQFMQGTSMATPLVAGCVAILREALLKANNITLPSSALIKALLINGATPLADTSKSTSGFGRVNMADTLAHTGPQLTPPLAGFGERSGPNALTLSRVPGDKLDEFSFPIVIPTGHAGRTLSVTLAWADPYGPELQHHLRLSVAKAGEPERAWDVDTIPNNVQRIVWSQAAEGEYKVVVKALQLFRQPPQAPYARDEVWAPFQPFTFAWRVY
ncbi:peptidase S8/S53 domain-containing protein [Cercophora newfieldiana]|uniref:Peptidase S8/S53 domain-containing protein n=1 Tax=Cercophora newfieldiana TaxID=92897 RepID=A0AA39XQS1_9PEZI|nr:peptidase S8/S53 domain-containing protein [Cercophora newfieldiana]